MLKVQRWPGAQHLSKDYSSANIDASMLPSPPPDFEGREVDMYRVISTIRERRLVSVVGDAGYGKSALLAASARYMSDRSMFTAGMLYVRLQGVESHHQFLMAVRNAISRGPSKIAAKLNQVFSCRVTRHPN